MVTTPVTSVTREVVKEVLINKLIPAIVTKFPRDFKEIHVQMDNAGSHRIDNEDKDWIVAVRNSGLNIKITKKPSNSPDLNVLDLGYFNSIQSLQKKNKMTTIDKLVSCVVD